MSTARFNVAEAGSPLLAGTLAATDDDDWFRGVSSFESDVALFDVFAPGSRLVDDEGSTSFTG